MPEGARIGHVHLCLGDVPRAEAFHAGIPGFGVSARYAGASFFGSGGYHHQTAADVWQSRGAGARPEGGAGLARLVLRVPDAARRAGIAARAAAAGIAVASEGEGFVLADPWGTAVAVAPCAGAAGRRDGRPSPVRAARPGSGSGEGGCLPPSTPRGYLDQGEGARVAARRGGRRPAGRAGRRRARRRGRAPAPRAGGKGPCGRDPGGGAGRTARARRAACAGAAARRRSGRAGRPQRPGEPGASPRARACAPRSR
jgi:hypothetical protein